MHEIERIVLYDTRMWSKGESGHRSWFHEKKALSMFVVIEEELVQMRVGRKLTAFEHTEGVEDVSDSGFVVVLVVGA
jgi:hypothetical protein